MILQCFKKLSVKTLTGHILQINRQRSNRFKFYKIIHHFPVIVLTEVTSLYPVKTIQIKPMDFGPFSAGQVHIR